MGVARDKSLLYLRIANFSNGLSFTMSISNFDSSLSILYLLFVNRPTVCTASTMLIKGM